MGNYIIDNEVFFFYKEKKLCSRKNNTVVSVPGTSTRCLVLLLEKQGEIVTQTELMIAGWGDDAIRHVSNAAYYQSFVILRRLFKELGYNRSPLITVRGRGIRFDKHVRVEKNEVNRLDEYFTEPHSIRKESNEGTYDSQNVTTNKMFKKQTSEGGTDKNELIPIFVHNNTSLLGKLIAFKIRACIFTGIMFLTSISL